MLVPLDYPFCSEMHIVEKTIHIVARIGGDDRHPNRSPTQPDQPNSLQHTLIHH